MISFYFGSWSVLFWEFIICQLQAVIISAWLIGIQNKMGDIIISFLLKSRVSFIPTIIKINHAIAPQLYCQINIRIHQFYWKIPTPASCFINNRFVLSDQSSTNCSLWLLNLRKMLISYDNVVWSFCFVQIMRQSKGPAATTQTLMMMNILSPQILPAIGYLALRSSLCKTAGLRLLAMSLVYFKVCSWCFQTRIWTEVCIKRYFM